jgi:hypothetical protein
MELRKVNADAEAGYSIGLNSAVCKSVPVMHMVASEVICPELLFKRIQVMMQTGM